VESAKAEYDDLQGQYDALDGLKTKAEEALQAATDQLSRESTWREWLYCELGSTDNVANAPTNWWSQLTTILTSGEREAGTAPTKCTVPAIPADGDSNTLERPAVEYYGSKTDLAEEKKPHDGGNW
jgi:hypothetical protein